MSQAGQSILSDAQDRMGRGKAVNGGLSSIGALLGIRPEHVLYSSPSLPRRFCSRLNHNMLMP